VAISIRKLGKAEADEAFAKVEQQQDPLLAMARRLVQQHEALRTRTLVAYLNEWGRASLVRPQLSGIAFDEAVMRRALALLTMEIDSAKSLLNGRTPQERGTWAADKLAKILAESAAATKAAELGNGTAASGPVQPASSSVDHFTGKAA
jgi:hypothetical protein